MKTVTFNILQYVCMHHNFFHNMPLTQSNHIKYAISLNNRFNTTPSAHTLTPPCLFGHLEDPHPLRHWIKTFFFCALRSLYCLPLLPSTFWQDFHFASENTGTTTIRYAGINKSNNNCRKFTKAKQENLFYTIISAISLANFRCNKL